MTDPRVIRGDFIIKGPNNRDYISFIGGVATISQAAVSALTAAGFTLGADAVTASGAELNTMDNAAQTVTIALAAGATNTLVATITVKDAAGNAITGVCHRFEAWISENVNGIGLTADTISGDATWGANQEVEEITSKKRFLVQTTVNGVATLSVVDSAKPADQYIAICHPVTGKVIVSAASGTSWG